MPAIAPITMSVLQHLYTHGASTRAQLVATLGDVPYSTLGNLRTLGHIAIDHGTTVPTYSITPRGHKKLAGLHGAPQQRDSNARRLEAARLAASYQGAEVRLPSNRPGAMDAFSLPSRVGSHLHWPDGRITPINPTSIGERHHG